MITYRVFPGEVRREERIGGQTRAAESYVLPRGWSASIAVRSEAAPAVASLIIADNRAPPAAGREMRVAAVLGKDHRFTKSPFGGQ